MTGRPRQAGCHDVVGQWCDGFPRHVAGGLNGSLIELLRLQHGSRVTLGQVPTIFAYRRTRQSLDRVCQVQLGPVCLLQSNIGGRVIPGHIGKRGKLAAWESYRIGWREVPVTAAVQPGLKSDRESHNESQGTPRESRRANRSGPLEQHRASHRTLAASRMRQQFRGVRATCCLVGRRSRPGCGGPQSSQAPLAAERCRSLNARRRRVRGQAQLFLLRPASPWPFHASAGYRPTPV